MRLCGLRSRRLILPVGLLILGLNHLSRNPHVLVAGWDPNDVVECRPCWRDGCQNGNPVDGGRMLIGGELCEEFCSSDGHCGLGANYEQRGAVDCRMRSRCQRLTQDLMRHEYRAGLAMWVLLSIVASMFLVGVVLNLLASD